MRVRPTLQPTRLKPRNMRLPPAPTTSCKICRTRTAVAGHSMLARFFNERAGSARFFKELERAKQNPGLNLGVLEVMHACLSLGFEGVYRASGGPGAAQGIRRDLYET